MKISELSQFEGSYDVLCDDVIRTKGSKCRFRHCEKAIGSDIVCSLWREGKCSHQLCKFRHMEIQQKYNSISCFWETQPLGCVRISCVFHHRKPRNINGLFLPPSNDSTLQGEVQEGILHAAQNQDSTKGQENSLRPIHPPLIITINLEDEEEEEQEEKYASYLLSKTPEDIEEEKAIKEMCYKSGEYYRIQTSQENHLTKNSSVLENELIKPMETCRELQEGDGVAVPSKFNIIERQTKITASVDSCSKSELSAFENGGGDCYLSQRNIFVEGIQNKMFNGEKQFTMLKCLNVKATSHTESIKKHHFKGVKKKKWLSEDSKNLPTPLTAKAMHTSNSKSKGNCQQNDQIKNAENASYVPSQRANGRSISLSAPMAGRSQNLTYAKIGVAKESKMNLSTERCASAYNIPAWRKRSPHSKIYTKPEKMHSGIYKSPEEMEVDKMEVNFKEKKEGIKKYYIALLWFAIKRGQNIQIQMIWLS
ncbi:uncharacterized protein C12orf50 homolog isoform X1 [Crotalus tigris]|uniref:uncharacterized protein C12orf50 homolog isoform X1 n=2 Tax=Crotalus tigris TaxID=88082 RepID=UPI00192F53FB|nr:uncharacterized protein C12orf50 homolog isoform X1 [Crotalus tigris]XP_039221130.1 uncharacterized protein C12orf50 homolog isoform X1 [Crotalus tigris]XP_039221132.1 uncharacterized protein C12orf50 homolog isoform X1 [Crotalus tigris]